MSFKVKDYYYKKAKQEKYLARSVYKLKEIDDKFHVLDRGASVLDLGYYPGSWTQFVAEIIGEKGRIIGVDIQPVNKNLCHLKNVSLFEKDVFEIEELQEISREEKFDVVLSDMAPKTTGMKSVDQDRSLNLVEMVFHILPRVLKEGGNVVVKVFDSHQAQEYLKGKKKIFKRCSFLKPKSTRGISKEFFVIGEGYLGHE